MGCRCLGKTEMCVQSGFAGCYAEVKVIAAVVSQEAQGAEQGPLQRDMLGSVGVWQGAWGKDCRGNTTRRRVLGSGFARQLCLFDFLFYLLPPQRFFSLLQQLLQLDHSRQFSFSVNEKLLHFVP